MINQDLKGSIDQVEKKTVSMIAENKKLITEDKAEYQKSFERLESIIKEL